MIHLTINTHITSCSWWCLSLTFHAWALFNVLFMHRFFTLLGGGRSMNNWKHIDVVKQSFCHEQTASTTFSRAFQLVPLTCCTMKRTNAFNDFQAVWCHRSIVPPCLDVRLMFYGYLWLRLRDRGVRYTPFSNFGSLKVCGSSHCKEEKIYSSVRVILLVVRGHSCCVFWRSPAKSKILMFTQSWMRR